MNISRNHVHAGTHTTPATIGTCAASPASVTRLGYISPTTPTSGASSAGRNVSSGAAHRQNSTSATLRPPSSLLGGSPPAGCSPPDTKHILRRTGSGSSGSTTGSWSSSPRYDMWSSGAYRFFST